MAGAGRERSTTISVALFLLGECESLLFVQTILP